MQINFPRPPLIIFTKGANNSDHDCVYIYIHLYIVRTHSKMTSTCDMGFRVLWKQIKIYTNAATCSNKYN